MILSLVVQWHLWSQFFNFSKNAFCDAFHVTLTKGLLVFNWALYGNAWIYKRGFIKKSACIRHNFQWDNSFSKNYLISIFSKKSKNFPSDFNGQTLAFIPVLTVLMLIENLYMKLRFYGLIIFRLATLFHFVFANYSRWRAELYWWV